MQIIDTKYTCSFGCWNANNVTDSGCLIEFSRAAVSVWVLGFLKDNLIGVIDGASMEYRNMYSYLMENLKGIERFATYYIEIWFWNNRTIKFRFKNPGFIFDKSEYDCDISLTILFHYPQFAIQ